MEDQLLLQKAWRKVKREEAEEILLSKPVGTYLFRKDHYASCLEEILAGAKQADLKCYTLAFLDTDYQVRERTVVSFKGKWLFYDDDPSLEEPSFISLEELLKSLPPIAIARVAM